MDTFKFAGRIYTAKSARIELLDIVKEQAAVHTHGDRVTLTKPVYDRIIGDLEHAVQLLDALQDERGRRIKAEERIPLLRLRELGEKAKGSEWFVQHGATEDGLSRIDDGCQDGMFPIHGEAHEIEFAAACVNHIRAALSRAKQEDER
jgi:hypothetical protein